MIGFAYLHYTPDLIGVHLVGLEVSANFLFGMGVVLPLGVHILQIEDCGQIVALGIYAFGVHPRGTVSQPHPITESLPNTHFKVLLLYLDA